MLGDCVFIRSPDTALMAVSAQGVSFVSHAAMRSHNERAALNPSAERSLRCKALYRDPVSGVSSSVRCMNAAKKSFCRAHQKALKGSGVGVKKMKLQRPKKWDTKRASPKHPKSYNLSIASLNRTSTSALDFSDVLAVSPVSGVVQRFAQPIQEQERLGCTAEHWAMPHCSPFKVLTKFLPSLLYTSTNPCDSDNHLRAIVNALMKSKISTDVFGTTATVELVMMLYDPVQLGLLTPASQLQDLLHLAVYFSEWNDELSYEDEGAFEPGAEFSRMVFKPKRGFARLPTNLEEMKVAFTNAVSSILVKGIVKEVSDAVGGGRSLLSLSFISAPRLMVLMHQSEHEGEFFNPLGVRSILNSETFSTISFPSNIKVLHSASHWSGYALDAKPLEELLMQLDDTVRESSTYKNSFVRGGDVVNWRGIKLDNLCSIFKNLDNKRGLVEAGKALPEVRQQPPPPPPQHPTPVGGSSLGSSGNQAGSSNGNDLSLGGSSTDGPLSHAQMNSIVGERLVSSAALVAGGYGGMSGQMVQALRSGKGDDAKYYSQMKAAIPGGEDAMLNQWLVLCDNYNRIVRSSAAKGDGLCFNHFLTCQWNKINFNYLDTTLHPDSFDSTDFSLHLGYESYKRQLKMFTVLNSVILGDVQAKAVEKHLIDTAEELLAEGTRWDESWSFLRCIVDDFVFRFDRWNFPAPIPSITEWCKRTRASRVRMELRTQMFTSYDPYVTAGWNLPAKVVEDVCYNAQAFKTIKGQNIPVAEGLMVLASSRQKTSNPAPAKKTKKATNAAVKQSKLIRQLEAQITSLEKAQGLTSKKNNGRRQTGRYSEGRVPCEYGEKCKNLKKHTYKLKDGREVGYCGFVHLDTPKSTTGPLATVLPELRALVLERRQG